MHRHKQTDRKTHTFTLVERHLAICRFLRRKKALGRWNGWANRQTKQKDRQRNRQTDKQTGKHCLTVFALVERHLFVVFVDVIDARLVGHEVYGRVDHVTAQRRVLSLHRRLTLQYGARRSV